MTLLERSTISGIGIDINTESRRMFNRSGAPIGRGDCLQLDTSFAQAESDSFVFGAVPSMWQNVVTVFGGRNGIYFLALEVVEDNMLGNFLLKGLCEFAGVTGSASVIRGTFVGPNVGNAAMIGPAASTTTARGLLLQTTAGAARDNVAVLFDGEMGFGRIN